MWEPWMLRHYGVRPRDVREYTMGELRRMAEALDNDAGGVT